MKLYDAIKWITGDLLNEGYHGGSDEGQAELIIDLCKGVVDIPIETRELENLSFEYYLKYKKGD